MAERSDRLSNGRFAVGSKGGPGNPYAAEVGKLRRAIYKVLREAVADGLMILKNHIQE